MIQRDTTAKLLDLYISSLVQVKCWSPLIRIASCFWIKYEGGALYIHRPSYAAIPASILLVDRSIEGEFTREVYSVVITDCHITIIKSNDSDRIVDDCFIYDR